MPDLDALVRDIAERVTAEVLRQIHGGEAVEDDYPDWDEYAIREAEDVANDERLDPTVPARAVTAPAPDPLASAANLEWEEPPTPQAAPSSGAHRLSGDQMAALYEREVVWQRALPPLQ